MAINFAALRAAAQAAQQPAAAPAAQRFVPIPGSNLTFDRERGYAMDTEGNVHPYSESQLQAAIAESAKQQQTTILTGDADYRAQQAGFQGKTRHNGIGSPVEGFDPATGTWRPLYHTMGQGSAEGGGGIVGQTFENTGVPFIQGNPEEDFAMKAIKSLALGLGLGGLGLGAAGAVGIGPAAGAGSTAGATAGTSAFEGGLLSGELGGAFGGMGEAAMADMLGLGSAADIAAMDSVLGLGGAVSSGVAGGMSEAAMADMLGLSTPADITAVGQSAVAPVTGGSILGNTVTAAPGAGTVATGAGTTAAGAAAAGTGLESILSNPSVIGAGLGAAASILGGGSQPAGTTTTVQDIPEWLKPYANTALGGLQDAYNATPNGMAPVTAAGNQYMQDVIGGNYLNSNPYLDAMFNKAAGQVSSKVNSQFSTAGRYGSGAHTGVLADSIGNLATDIYGKNYATERQNQQQAAGASADFGNATINQPFLKGQNLLQGIRSIGGGQTTQPYFQNQVGDLLSGALGGMTLGKLFGK